MQITLLLSVLARNKSYQFKGDLPINSSLFVINLNKNNFAQKIARYLVAKLHTGQITNLLKFII